MDFFSIKIPFEGFYLFWGFYQFVDFIHFSYFIHYGDSVRDGDTCPLISHADNPAHLTLTDKPANQPKLTKLNFTERNIITIFNLYFPFNYSKCGTNVQTNKQVVMGIR